MEEFENEISIDKLEKYNKIEIRYIKRIIAENLSFNNCKTEEDKQIITNIFNQLANSKDYYTRSNIVKNINTPIEVLQEFIKKKDFTNFIEDIIKNPCIPKDMLMNIINNEENLSILENISLHSEDLDLLTMLANNTKYEGIACAIINNPNVSIEIINTIYNRNFQHLQDITDNYVSKVKEISDEIMTTKNDEIILQYADINIESIKERILFRFSNMVTSNNENINNILTKLITQNSNSVILNSIKKFSNIKELLDNLLEDYQNTNFTEITGLDISSLKKLDIETAFEKIHEGLKDAKEKGLELKSLNNQLEKK